MIARYRAHGKRYSENISVKERFWACKQAHYLPKASGISALNLHKIKAGGSQMKQTNCKNCDTKSTKKSASTKRSSSNCSNCGSSK